MQFLKKYPFTPAIIFFLITLVLFTLPGSAFPKTEWLGIPHLDKLVHVSIFVLLSILFNYPIQQHHISRKERVEWFWMICLSGISYGIAVEFIQKYWVINRSFELMDIFADSIGCFIAIVISYKRFLKFKEQ